MGDQPGGNYSASHFTDVNVNGAWLGLISQSFSGGNSENAPHQGDLLTTERFGSRIPRVTSRWAMGAKAFPTQAVSESESRRRKLAGPSEWRQFDD